MAWYVYIVECRDGTLYTGVTNDLEARLVAHNAGTGARYTRSRRPVRLRWCHRTRGRSAALRKEHAIKKLPRHEKDCLIAGGIRSSGGRRPHRRGGGRPLAGRGRPASRP